MHKTKDQLYELVSDLKTKSEFDKAIQERSQECDGLLDEDTIALLLVDELGRNNEVITKISDMKPDTDCTIVGKITNIQESKKFKKKNGSSGEVVNLEITDETGTCGLVLWNDDVKLLDNGITKGTTVKIINGYTKDGFSGLEINLGRWGLLQVEPENVSDLEHVEPDTDQTEITGVLTHKEPTRAFFRDSGEFGFVTTIKIKEETGEKQLVLWGEKVKDIQQFKIGDNIKIANTSFKENNGKTEIHVSGNSIIQKC